MTPLHLILFLVGSALGALGIIRWASSRPSFQGKLQTQIDATLKEAHKQVEEIHKEFSEKRESVIKEEEEENKRLKAHLDRLEEVLKLKEKHLEQRLEKNQEFQKAVQEVQTEMQSMRKEMEESKLEIIEVMLKKVGKTKEEVLNELSAQCYHEVINRKEKFVKQRVGEVEEESQKMAKATLVSVLQRYTDPSSVDRTNNLIEVRQERFKAMLVGNRAENIQHLEEISGVDIIFNDAPKTITIANGNLLKRQFVKCAIDLLQKSGQNISPARIDAAFAKAQEKVNQVMRQKALEAVKKVGLSDVPDGVLNYIGRLHFRTSYGQNALKHCIEVGLFAGLIAAEIGANIEVARFAGFFHDIGKALSEESEKGHDFITKDILEEFHYPEDIIHAAWVHHEAEPAKTLEAKIVMAADALSASRPGARLESLDRYIERIRDLEATAGSFEGVKKTFAISAGREVRVLVSPEKINDEQLRELAHDIAEKIETNLTYPGNVKVNVIRRMKWTLKAKSKVK
ncbi:MAG: Metal dependent phosphohydrolase [uncultured bacterium]|nr:MAG: Metal dependent phosphohydrolase [uncultured bacterium]